MQSDLWAHNFLDFPPAGAKTSSARVHTHTHSAEKTAAERGDCGSGELTDTISRSQEAALGEISSSLFLHCTKGHRSLSPSSSLPRSPRHYLLAISSPDSPPRPSLHPPPSCRSRVKPASLQRASGWQLLHRSTPLAKRKKKRKKKMKNKKVSLYLSTFLMYLL